MSWKIILITALILCFVGAELRNTGEISEEEFYNISNNVNYDSLNFTSFNEQGSDQNNTFVQRTVYKTADLIAFVTVEGAFESMKLGWEHPEYNYELAWKLLFVAIAAPLIVPLLYLILFTWYFIKLLVQIIKKWRKKHNEI